MQPQEDQLTVMLSDCGEKAGIPQAAKRELLYAQGEHATLRRNTPAGFLKESGPIDEQLTTHNFYSENQCEMKKNNNLKTNACVKEFNFN